MGVVFWCGSYFLAQTDYIHMFVSIACSIWLAGAGRRALPHSQAR